MIMDFGQRSFVTHTTGLKEKIEKAENRPYWKCTICGLELTFEEVCQSGGHTHPELMEQDK